MLKDGHNRIMNQVNNNNAYEAKLFFIDGPGGTGKTYLFNVNILNYIYFLGLINNYLN